MIGQEEKELVLGLIPFLSENPVIFDVGSNKGGFTDIILEELGEECDIHLFEPNNKLLSFTEIKYEYKKNITYNNYGLYRENATKDFFYFENYNNEISSIYISDDWANLPMKVKAINLITASEYGKTKKIDRIDYIKIDCEGADVDVLLGCESLMAESKVVVIQIEYGENYRRANCTFQQAIDLSAKYGYKVYYFKNGNYYELTDFIEDYHYENYIITKEEIHNYSKDGGWLDAFKESVEGLPKFEMCLEIGTYEGFTAKYMCENMLLDGGRVVVVDPLMDTYIRGDVEHTYFRGQYQRFKRNTKGLPIDLFRGNSEDELPKLNALRFCFCYIDGNHFAPYPYIDACWAFAITKEGGYILFDDYDVWREDTKECIDEFLKEYEGHYSILKKGYQLLIQKHTDKYNSITESYYL